MGHEWRMDGGRMYEWMGEDRRMNGVCVKCGGIGRER